MHIYYALWKFTVNRFNEPLLYDYSFSVRFPNVIFRAKDFNDAKEKIRIINSKIEKIDRFDDKYSKILKQTLS